MRRHQFLLSAMAAALALTACGGEPGATSPGDSGPPDDAAASGLDRLRQEGLYVAYYGDHKQYAYVDFETGEYTGAMAEVVKECATRLGIEEVNPVGLEWAGIIPAVQSGRVDMMAGGMAYNDERAEVALPSEYIFHFGERPVVPRGNPAGVNSYQDLVDSGITVAFITGALTEEVLDKYGINKRAYESQDAIYADLRAGRVDALLTDEGGAYAYLEANPDEQFEVVDPWDYDGNLFYTVFYFNRDDEDVRDAFDSCIAELKEDGTIADLLEQFGLGSDDNVDPVGARGG